VFGGGKIRENPRSGTALAVSKYPGNSMELSQFLKDLDESERLRRQIINPLADLQQYQFPDYQMDETVEAILNKASEDYERMRRAIYPLDGIRFPSVENEASALYDAMKPMRDATAIAMESARGIYDSMQPIRDVISSFEENARLLDVLAPARRLAQEISLNQIVKSTDSINQILAENDFMARAKAFQGYGESLSLTLSPLPHLHDEWLSAIGRFDGTTIDFYGPTIAIPSREVEGSFKESQIIIGDDYDEEAIGRPNLPELEELIAMVSPSLLPSYRGALKRMNDIDDDYQRQAIVSLRTFVQKLMEMLAPDEVAGAYLMATESKALSGPPSWVIRIEAAYDSLGQPALTNTMKTRAKIMALNMDILQKIVHDLPEQHSHDQLQHYFNNALGSVRNILEVFHLARRKR
jgi:hypothetical protein